MSISKVGQGDEIFQVGVFVNGGLVLTGMSTGAATSLVGFVRTTVPHTLQTGDIIDMRVRNITGTDDCRLLEAQLIIV
jgi:hypothetical protein